MRKITPTHITLLVITLIGFWLRLHYVDRSMRFDEALSFMEYASSNVPSIMANYSEPNNHILNSLLMHIVYGLFGNHPVIIRMPAWVPGVLLIPLAYEVARRLFNARVGLLAAGFVAVSPPLVDYSVNARGYSLQTFLTLLLFWLSFRLMQKNRSADWLLFALVSALGFLAIPTMLYPMGALALWLLLTIWLDHPRYRRRVLLKNYLVGIVLGAVLTLVFYTPVILFSGLERLIANPYVEPEPAAVFYRQFGVNYVAFFAWMHKWLPTVTGGVLAVAAVAGTLAHGRISAYRVPPLIPALVWLTLALAVQRVFPYPRVIMPLLPLYLIVAAAGIVWALRRRFVPALALAWCVIVGGYIVQANVILTSEETGRAEDAEQAAFYFMENTARNDVIAYSYPTNYAVLYYQELHGLDPDTKPTTDEPRIYIYTHSQEERERLLTDLFTLDETFAGAAFEPAHQFPHSTLEEVIP